MVNDSESDDISAEGEEYLRSLIDNIDRYDESVDFSDVELGMPKTGHTTK